MPRWLIANRVPKGGTSGAVYFSQKGFRREQIVDKKGGLGQLRFAARVRVNRVKKENAGKIVYPLPGDERNVK